MEKYEISMPKYPLTMSKYAQTMQKFMPNFNDKNRNVFWKTVLWENFDFCWTAKILKENNHYPKKIQSFRGRVRGGGGW